MNNLENLFIPTELSQQLIELGFDKNECIAGRDTLNHINSKLGSTYDGSKIYWYKYDSDIPLILWDQVIDWFDTKGIFITVRTYYIDTVIEYGFTIKYGTEYITKYEFNSKYEANKNAIVKAIELYESFLKEIKDERN